MCRCILCTYICVCRVFFCVCKSGQQLFWFAKYLIMIIWLWIMYVTQTILIIFLLHIFLHLVKPRSSYNILLYQYVCLSLSPHNQQYCPQCWIFSWIIEARCFHFLSINFHKIIIIIQEFDENNIKSVEKNCFSVLII